MNQQNEANMADDGTDGQKRYIPVFANVLFPEVTVSLRLAKGLKDVAESDRLETAFSEIFAYTECIEAPIAPPTGSSLTPGCK